LITYPTGQGRSRIPRKNRHCVLRLITDQPILVPTRRKADEPQDFFVLNSAGLLIWQLLDDRRSIEEIAGEVALKYGLPKERALEDTVNYLSQLARIGATLPDSP